MIFFISFQKKVNINTLSMKRNSKKNRSKSIYILMLFFIVAKPSFSQDYSEEIRQIFTHEKELNIMVDDHMFGIRPYNYFISNDSVFMVTDKLVYVFALNDVDFNATKTGKSGTYTLGNTSEYVYCVELAFLKDKGQYMIMHDNKLSLDNFVIDLYFANNEMAQEALKYLRKQAGLQETNNPSDKPKGTVSASSSNLTSTSKDKQTTTFESVQIKNQIWMSKNLEVTTFSNGDEIPQIKTKEEWEKASKAKTPGWCYYEFNPANGEKYGKLYNYYAVSDPRGLAPKGWHIPSSDELEVLTEVPSFDSGKKLKSTSEWEKYEALDDDYQPTGKVYGNGNNASGFDGRPGGYCNELGFFKDLNKSGYWWSTSPGVLLDGSGDMGSLRLQNVMDMAFVLTNRKGDGLSIRCIKDK